MRAWLFLLLPLAAGCATPADDSGGTPGSALLVTDRRSQAAYNEDQAIETRLSNRILARYGRDAHVTVTSFNRQVLLSGEVVNERLRSDIDALARQGENVRTVFNETLTGPISSLPSRSQDAWITSQLRARLLGQRDVAAGHVRIVTEAGTVYLLGLVKLREADAAAATAARVPGVKKVVTLFEYLD